MKLVFVLLTVFSITLCNEQFMNGLLEGHPDVLSLPKDITMNEAKDLLDSFVNENFVKEIVEKFSKLKNEYDAGNFTEAGKSFGEISKVIFLMLLQLPLLPLQKAKTSSQKRPP